MLKSVFKEVFVNAKLEYSLVIENFKTGYKCKENSQNIMPSASVIKIFIMGAAFDLASKEKVNLNNHIYVEKNKNVDFSLVSILDSVKSYSIHDLIKLMITTSDNTATNMLIDFFGFQYINNFIKERGFNNTILARKMMDFKAKQEGKENYTSAEDTFDFLKMLYNGKLVDECFDKEMIDILKLQMDNSMMKMKIPDSLCVAHKTGDLNCVKNDVGIVYSREIGDYVFVIFTKNAVSDEYARDFVANTSKIVYDFFSLGDL